ncbi:MAG: response regulator transcription factor [Bacteroidia bacterium]|nr:response regulator transcription factor [Bacteroidia bacterium]
MEKILVIEDDPVLNQNIRDALAENLMSVQTVFDGLMGEKILKKERFDCIVLDINLPHKNGYDLCREFRLHNTETPVLMLTVFDELEDKILGYASGADDYLTKPFYMKELILRINSLIKRRNLNVMTDTSESAIVAGDLVIHPRTQKVTRQGLEISLTPREYQILLRLVGSKGEFVLKKDLIKEIWGTSFDANTNTIEVYINFLRKKIDKPFGKNSIKTRVGFGYSFVEE